MKRNLLLLAAAPVLGLVFVVFLPLVGFVVTFRAIIDKTLVMCRPRRHVVS